MRTAKNLKNLAGQIRRTETALRNLVSQMDLSDGERKELLAAATVLDLKVGKIALAARKAKRDEEAEEKAIAKARVIASELLKSWPSETVLDKVAICAMNHLEANLRRDLQEGRRDWKWSLDYWISSALREIPSDAAWRSVREGKPVSELMSAFREKLDAIKSHPTILVLAERWQANIENEQRLEKASTTG